MLLYTVETIPGKEFELLGMVQGSTVQSKHIGKDLMAGLKNLVGGEMKGYTEMLNDVQDELCNQICNDLTDLIFNATIGDW